MILTDSSVGMGACNGMNKDADTLASFGLPSFHWVLAKTKKNVDRLPCQPLHRVEALLQNSAEDIRHSILLAFFRFHSSASLKKSH